MATGGVGGGGAAGGGKLSLVSNLFFCILNSGFLPRILLIESLYLSDDKYK